jgi:hypothetical protein
VVSRPIGSAQLGEGEIKQLRAKLLQQQAGNVAGESKLQVRLD